MQSDTQITSLVPEDIKKRLEIDEFLGDNDMTNLFLLALSDLQKEAPEKAGKTEDWFTYYSLSSM